MYIKKFIYVNWGNIPNTEFEFGPINLFSGGNGSGKTTAADAIQTMMTAAHDNLFHFNPGQDESTQRGRGGKLVRTLASYVLGCDDGAYARPFTCDGYLAVVFHPTQGEQAEVFTAVVALRAYLETNATHKTARLDECLFYILPQEALSLTDFVREDKGGSYVVGSDRIYSLLRKQYGSQAVEKYDKKKTYLCRLYGILRGKRDAVSEREALNAARAFSRFMAYKPVKSINNFVADEILEAKDLGDAIRDVSGMLKRIHAMENDARLLNQSIALLGDAKASADSYISQWTEQQLQVYTEAKCRYNSEQSAYLNAKRAQEDFREALKQNQTERQLADTRRSEIRRQLRHLEAKRLGIPALRDKDQLESDIERATQTLHRQTPQLLRQDQQLQSNIAACDIINKLCQHTSLSLDIAGLKDKALKNLSQDILSSSQSGGVDIQSFFIRDWVDISPLENHLDKIIELQQKHNSWVGRWLNAPEQQSSLRDQVLRERDKRQERSLQLQRQVERKRNEIDLLKAQQISYPAFVKTALDAIRKQCPAADARVLCDHVEIIDPVWQSAIEGYIATARYGIMVESSYEAQAIEIVRALSGRDNRARVIQGEKARQDAERVELPDNSLARIMTFTHATAEHYIKASYGSVKRVESAEDLRQTRRGVTKDCLGSGNYTLFCCDMADSELVFGQRARERALSAKQEELQVLGKEWQQYDGVLNDIASLLAAVETIKALTYADILQTTLEWQRKLRVAEESLEQLDLEDFKLLEAELETLREDEQRQDDNVSLLDHGKGELTAKLHQCDAQCKGLSKAQEDTQKDVDTCEDNLRKICGIWPEFNVEQHFQDADTKAANTPLKQLQAELENFGRELSQHFNRLQQLLLTHNGHCAIADSIPFEPNFHEENSLTFFQFICHVQRQLDTVHNRLKNNILASKHSELELLKQSFNNTFVTNLCHSIYQAINDGKRTLEELNRELEHHRFGADRERYYFDADWVPEFKEYWQFFKAIIDSPSLGDGETLFNMSLSEKNIRVRDHLMEMLLNDDENKAQRELERISDYRHYRNYEIYKEPENKAPIALSQYGTGSGGQLETPAYIIRSAAITSAFRFNEGKSHLRMVLVDEAFSKMDEHRSREVIDYLTEALGLQLLFIMPTSKSGPFMDLISNQFVFSKCPTLTAVGSQSELETQVLVDRQQCDKDKIRELWANHRSTIHRQGGFDFMEEFAET